MRFYFSIELRTDGYVYVAQTDKYYRPYKGAQEQFMQALETCQADGATLVEFRTPAEQKVMKQLHGKCFWFWVRIEQCHSKPPQESYSSVFSLLIGFFPTSNVWIGVANHKLIKCNNDACLNSSVTWLSDGTPIYDRPNNQLIKMDNPAFCSSLREADGSVDDGACHSSLNFMCEFSCDKGTNALFAFCKYARSSMEDNWPLCRCVNNLSQALSPKKHRNVGCWGHWVQIWLLNATYRWILL